MDAATVGSGLAGYNGCLVGCAFAVFLGGPVWAAPLATVAGGAASAFVSAAIRPMMGSVPQWTFAFNATTLAALAAVRPLAGNAASAAADSVAAVPPDAAVTAPLSGVAQIFVSSSPLTGALVLVGMGWFSPGCAAHTLLGATIGAGTGALLGAPIVEICDGVWSFNAALSSLAVGVFFVPSRASLALSTYAAASATVLFGGLKVACAEAFGVPCLTLPFCVVASGCYLLPQSVPALVLAAAPHSPERNRAAASRPPS